MADKSYIRRSETDEMGDDQRSPLLRDTQEDETVRDARKLKLPPAEQSNGGFVDPTTEGPQPVAGAAIDPAKGPPAPVFSNEPSTLDSIGEMIRTGSLNNSPYMQQIAANYQKLIALRAQPTYVNKKGETVQGMEDQDGRWQSGLKALVAGLAEQYGNGPVRDWNEFYARLGGSIGGGIGGAIAPEWNEWAERGRQIQRLEGETKQMMGMAEWQQKMQGMDIRNQTAVQKQDLNERKFAHRQEEDEFKRHDSNKKNLFRQIAQAGRYIRGENRELDDQLAAAGITMSDFDKNIKPQNRNGQLFTYDFEAKDWVPSKGLPDDPDEIPITYSVDGKTVTSSMKRFLGYAGAKERQASQHAFTAGENEKNRAVQWARIKESAEQFRARNAAEITQRRLAIQKSLDEQSISQDEANELLDILKRNNPDY